MRDWISELRAAVDARDFYAIADLREQAEASGVEGAIRAVIREQYEIFKPAELF